ncbi:MAG: hypothetical protein CMP63_07225 [Flavobacteriales bacterium]|nr:hypothetical protein [Flavobacteriales bacterium]
MKLKITNLLVLIFFSFVLNAQENQKCATDNLHRKQIENNPQLKIQLQKNEAILQKFINNQYFNFKSTEEVLRVPVVIHIMHLGEAEGEGNNISNAQIESGIQQLNDAFRNVNGMGEDIGIEFALAIQAPNGESTTGVVRYNASGEPEYASDGISTGSGDGLAETDLKALSKWPKDQYYNIWIVSEINGNDGGSGIQGFAYLPGAEAEYDGTVIQNTSWGDQGTVNNWNNLGTTIIHELGHGLNLYHTFHTENEADTTPDGCPLNTNCKDQGDRCCDTDPHLVSSSLSCDTAEINQCTGKLLGNLVRNYMDYSEQECQVLFTADQKARMRGTLLTTRKSLLASKALTPSVSVCENPIANSCIPQTQSDGLEGNYAGIGTFEIEKKVVSNSKTAYFDNGYLDKTSECEVTAFLTPDSSYKVKILPAGGINTLNSKVWIDYDNSGYFTSEELIFEGNHSGIVADSTNFTIPNTAVQNEFIRLRAAIDIPAITGPCYEPQYGQIEDYTIYLYTPEEITSQENINYHKLSVYPNPVESSLSIQFDYSGLYNGDLIIRDLQGRLINSKAINGRLKIITNVDVSGFQKGIYTLALINQEGTISQNFVVK